MDPQLSGDVVATGAAAACGECLWRLGLDPATAAAAATMLLFTVRSVVPVVAAWWKDRRRHVQRVERKRAKVRPAPLP